MDTSEKPKWSWIPFKKDLTKEEFSWVMGLVGTFGLAFVPERLWFVILVVFIISSIGYAGNTKIYDAFLIDVTDNKKMNWVPA